MNDRKQKIWIKTYGCQMNARDSETLAALLTADGHTIVTREQEADIALLNTCSVRDTAERKAIGKAQRLLYHKAKNPHYRVGILGCMAARRKEQLWKLLPTLDWVVPPQALGSVPQLIRETLQQPSPTKIIPVAPGDTFRCYEQPLPPSPVLQIPIQQGCGMHCSYCIVPQTRGPQQNRSFHSICSEIQQAVCNRTREVQLLGQIVNAYRDPNTGQTFVDLLHAIQAIEGIERIRFVSPHPAFFNDALIDCFRQLPKLCPAIHLPVQSGSNRILEWMKRGYTQEKILTLVQALRAIDPKFSISTDLIVGYPGETEADFEETRRLFEKIQFDMAYVFIYSPRPGTTAATRQSASLEHDQALLEKRQQCLLTALSSASLRYNRQFLQTQQTVLVEGLAPHGTGKYFGRNRYNKKVIFDGNPTLCGTFQTVQIEKATVSALEGKITMNR